MLSLSLLIVLPGRSGADPPAPERLRARLRELGWAIEEDRDKLQALGARALWVHDQLFATLRCAEYTYGVFESRDHGSELPEMALRITDFASEFAPGLHATRRTRFVSRALRWRHQDFPARRLAKDAAGGTLAGIDATLLNWGLDDGTHFWHGWFPGPSIGRVTTFRRGDETYERWQVLTGSEGGLVPRADAGALGPGLMQATLAAADVVLLPPPAAAGDPLFDAPRGAAHGLIEGHPLSALGTDFESSEYAVFEGAQDLPTGVFVARRDDLLGMFYMTQSEQGSFVSVRTFGQPHLLLRESSHARAAASGTLTAESTLVRFREVMDAEGRTLQLPQAIHRSNIPSSLALDLLGLGEAPHPEGSGFEEHAEFFTWRRVNDAALEGGEDYRLHDLASAVGLRMAVLRSEDDRAHGAGLWDPGMLPVGPPENMPTFLERFDRQDAEFLVEHGLPIDPSQVAPLAGLVTLVERREARDWHDRWFRVESDGTRTPVERGPESGN